MEEDNIRARIAYAAHLLERQLTNPPGDPDAFAHAARLWQSVLDKLPDHDPRRPALLTDLASTLYRWSEVTADTDLRLLEQAIDQQKQALHLAPPDHPDRCVMQVSLALLVRSRFLVGHAPADAEQAVRLARAAVAAVGDHPSRARLTANIAAVLLACLPGEVNELEPLALDALAGPPADSPTTAKLQLALAETRYRRAARSDDNVNVEATITAAQAAVDAVAQPGPLRAAALLHLATAKQTRWRRNGTLADLDAAIELRRSAATAGPAHDQMADLHTGLATALRDRYERHGDLRDLAEALTHGRTALRFCPARSPVRARCLANLSSVYRIRFARTQRPVDLLRSVRTAREAVTRTATSDPDLPRRLGTLTLALLREFSRHRDRRRLDEAIQVSRDAVAATPPGHPLRPPLLSNVASALRTRYEWTGDLTDLNEAAALARTAVQNTRLEDPARARRQAALGTALLRRFESSGRRADIDEAVRHTRAAAQGLPDDHPDRPGLLANLGLAHFRRFEFSGDDADLQQSLDYGRAAYGALPRDHPDRAQLLSHLAAPLRERYLRTGAEPDLVAAVAAADAAARTLADGDTHFNLGMVLRMRHERDVLAGTATGADRAAAIDAFGVCANSSGSAPIIRAAAAAYQAQLWVENGDWTAADASYAQALELLPVLTGRQLGWDSRHRQLARLAGLGADAAAVAIHLDDRDRALVLLEQARGVLIGQSIEQRRDIEALRTADEGLAEEFTRLAGLLTADTAVSTEFDADTDAMTDPAAARRNTVARWNTLIATIRRQVSGQEEFLGPPRLGDLLPAAAGGPVIIVNTSRYRCDALIVRTTGVELVRLPGLFQADVTAQVRAVLAVTAEGGVTENDTVLPDALHWLHMTVTKPVLDALGPGTDRVWWMPTGVLGTLPLHAAAPREPEGPALSDRVVSSYTTTLRALIDARNLQSGPAPTDGRAVVIAMTETPGHATLPAAGIEADAVTPLLSGRPKRLAEEQATPVAVLNALRHAYSVHVACHAVIDMADPASGALLLAGGRLPVRAIAAQPRQRRSLAYLSACTTAFSHGLLADEAMHVASAFQLAGFGTVVGTLWRIDDDQAYQVAVAFYRGLRAGRPPAMALDHAVRELRDRYPNSPALWAGFVHIGV
ncbi:CHAT domain-containing tetratricopeptide repeat protein [Micromonospora parva]|uniref:CHAT domain-containing tetratricopeptide repeat protein n=1 Tax=Micromonospora parva TaxID=1464048 RepID=UPI0033FC8C5B